MVLGTTAVTVEVEAEAREEAAPVGAWIWPSVIWETRPAVEEPVAAEEEAAPVV